MPRVPNNFFGFTGITFDEIEVNIGGTGQGVLDNLEFTSVPAARDPGLARRRAAGPGARSPAPAHRAPLSRLAAGAAVTGRPLPRQAFLEGSPRRPRRPARRARNRRRVTTRLQSFRRSRTVTAVALLGAGVIGVAAVAMTVVRLGGLIGRSIVTSPEPLSLVLLSAMLLTTALSLSHSTFLALRKTLARR